jgi:hypothetical protein
MAARAGAVPFEHSDDSFPLQAAGCGILPLRLIPRLGGVIALVENEKVI